MKRILYALMAISAFVTVSCTIENPNSFEYLRVDLSSYMFKTDGSDTCTVNIESNVAWDCGELPDWLKEVERTENSISFVAEPNSTKEIRMSAVNIISEVEVCEISMNQMASGFRGRFVDLHGLLDVIMSRDGSYIAGMKSEIDDDGKYLFTPVVINTKTGEVSEKSKTSEYTSVQYISNDGRKLILMHGINEKTRLFVDDELVDLYLPEGYKKYVIWSANDDASVIVGWIWKNNPMSHYTPARWVNGELETLEIPEKNLYEYDLVLGAMVRGCSADGSVMYGSEWDSKGLIIWNENGMDFVAKTLAENEIIYSNGYPVDFTGLQADAMTQRMSPDGRYLSAYFKGLENYYPAIIDLETGECEVMEGFSGIGFCANNNGDFYISGPFRMNTNGYVIRMGEEEVSVCEWMAEKYGISVTEDNTIVNVSEDESVILGMRVAVTVLGTLQYNYWYLSTNPIDEE